MVKTILALVLAVVGTVGTLVEVSSAVSGRVTAVLAAIEVR